MLVVMNVLRIADVWVVIFPPTSAVFCCMLDVLTGIAEAQHESLQQTLHVTGKCAIYYLAQKIYAV